jgi:hypothetical protein
MQKSMQLMALDNSNICVFLEFKAQSINYFVAIESHLLFQFIWAIYAAHLITILFQKIHLSVFASVAHQL